MFSPIEGGSQYVLEVDDIKYVCYLPPVGKVWNHVTKRVEDSEIIIRSGFHEEQYWEPPKPPENYKAKAAMERRRQELELSYYDEELSAYRDREWHRRLFGAWFMNNGVATFVTNDHYMYLTHWHIDVGLPDFRICDMEKWYFLKFCDEDPQCYGSVDLTKRRGGKSYMAGLWAFSKISMTSNANGGIQSKTNKDAKKFFGKCVIQPFRKLPDFFQPKYDTSSGTNPKNELRFFETSRRGGKGVADYDSGSELGSAIDFEASVETAYDGQKLLRYVCDEVFKTVEVNILDRHNIIKPCLEDSSGNIIGKAMYTSTVEEMEGHMELYETLWNDSDYTKKNKNGRTKSGLYRWFTPAQRSMNFDKYGFADEKKSLEWIENEIESRTDPRERAGFIRKYARNWQEAFRSDGKDCYYDVIKIDERLDFLKTQTRNWVKCKLVWDINESGNAVVKRVESSTGNFKFSRVFDQMSNAVVKRAGDQYFPLNKGKFAIGIDPYEHDRTVSGQFSDGAAAVFYKFDSLNTEDSENFVCIYVGRPPTAKKFYEEMVKLCHYFGAPMLFENTRGQGLKNHFKERGYGAFLIRDAKGTEGIAASEKATAELMDETEHFIDESCHRVNFPELLTDWKKFDMLDTTKYDLAMASGYCLMLASRIRRITQAKSKVNKASINDFKKAFSLGRRRPTTIKQFLKRKEPKTWHQQFSQTTI